MHGDFVREVSSFDEWAFDQATLNCYERSRIQFRILFEENYDRAVFETSAMDTHDITEAHDTVPDTHESGAVDHS